VNNPFWWSADEKFFNNCLAVQLGVPVPKTFLLPSKERPDDTTDKSFRNLNMMNWDAIFERIGFPAFMKPHAGGGWKSVYKVHNPQEFYQAYDETGQLVMLYQEAIEFDDYFRCYCIGGKDVRIMPYEPRNPHHLRYASEPKATGPALEKLLANGKRNTYWPSILALVMILIRLSLPFVMVFLSLSTSVTQPLMPIFIRLGRKTLTGWLKQPRILPSNAQNYLSPAK